VNLPERLRQWVAEGRLGEKSGRGFYRYARGRARAPKGRPRRTDLREITDRLLFSMLRECLACLREGIVEDADLLDAGMLFGTGFPPFRGGPMHYLSHQDPSVLERRLEDLNRAHGGRFAVELRDRSPVDPAHAPAG
jgi:3-hydroxyacyl-CoA dehydrogenase/enoyl-CoA hydratase/3-hydroxybutyryl-CoA epimerase